MIERECLAHRSLKCMESDQHGEAKGKHREVQVRLRAHQAHVEHDQEHDLDDMGPPEPREIVPAGQVLYTSFSSPHINGRMYPRCVNSP